MTQKFTLHLLDESYFGNIRQLEQDSHSHPWSDANIMSALSGHRTSVLGLLSSDLNELAAYAVFDGVLDEMTLQNIAVAKAFRRRGLAEQLISASWHYFPSAQTQFLEVRESNSAAINLYNKLGFVEVGVRDNYYPCDRKDREDAIIMALTRLDECN